MSSSRLSGGLGGARAAAPATRTIHRQYRVLNVGWTINKTYEPSLFSLRLRKVNQMPTRADTIQTIAERKLNASAAFQRAQSESPRKCQDQMLPQGKSLMASTRIPKAANQANEMRMSTAQTLVAIEKRIAENGYVQGQEKKPEEKGINQSRPNRIETPEMTSV